MVAYLARRILQLVPVVLIVTAICFVLFRSLGDPVGMMLGQYGNQQDRERVRKELGLDKPIYIQYLVFWKNILHGDFGTSYLRHQPVLKLIAERIPATVELATIAMVIAFGGGALLGVLSAQKRSSLLDRSVMVFSLFGISAPTFLVGILLILLFAVKLRLLPAFGRGELVTVGFWRTGLLTSSGISHLVLPVVTLGLYEFAMLLRLAKAGTLEVLGEDYIRSAWAKGLPQRTVLFKHAIRNAILPLLTIGGLQYGELLAFTLITETIFQWPGMGRFFLDSVYNDDQPIVIAYLLLVSVMVLTINLLVDMTYALLDPRVRYD